ncbi:hypothetical protein [Aestuariivirga litoralis]|uniref:hypothetical protein n=1 Tax=Aestuariivirga litoralis TaxID=2650924 RepID=UPI0018C80C62|nr:hypothetical protein [Aestuariivirga litoralis]MBG1230936.1 hypothetical protein [Aestuariivirga litoralis]
MKYHLLAAFAVLCVATPSRAECLDEIKAMMQAHLASGPYHVSMDQSMGGTTRKIEADVILPSSFHMKSPEMEAVMLKQGTWMKMGGAWRQMPAAMTGAMSGAMKMEIEDGMKNVKNAQCLGSQSIEGQNLDAFIFDSNANVMGTKVISHITAYKDAQGRPAIMIIDGEAMGKKSKTVQHITYDPAITISPPK